MPIPSWLSRDIAIHGYWIVTLAVALESMGVPFPGETALLAAAIFAGTTGQLSIAGVILAASIGAILGDNIGFGIGHFGGYPLLHRLARVFHVRESALAYAERYFARHGDKTVFLGRFFSLLRTYVAFLAGVNRMPWRVFLLWNALGGICWSILYGVLGFVLGHNLALLARILSILGTVGIVSLALFVAGAIALWILHRRRQDQVPVPDAANASDLPGDRREVGKPGA